MSPLCLSKKTSEKFSEVIITLTENTAVAANTAAQKPTAKQSSHLLEKAMKALFFLCACVSVAAVIVICIFMFAKGCPAIAKIGVGNFLFGTDWSPRNVPASYGIFPMIVGSLYCTAGAIIIGVPIGLLTAIFMAKFCPKKLFKWLMPPINLLAGIPSIVYGFFGMVVVVPIIRNLFGGTGNSVLTVSIILGIMILPTIVGMSVSALKAVPDSYYEGAVALGATHERAVATVVFPAAKSGILASVILAVGRAIGETMAVIMIAGNSTIIPHSLMDSVRTLTGNIVIEMSYAEGLHYDALIGTGVVLFVFILLLNLCFNLVTNRKDKG